MPTKKCPQHRTARHCQVLDEHGEFKEDNFKKLQQVFKDDKAPNGSAEGGAGKKGPKRGAQTSSDLRKIVKLIKDKKLDPVIVFSFSRRSEWGALCMEALWECFCIAGLGSCIEGQLILGGGERSTPSAACSSLAPHDRQGPDISVVTCTSPPPPFLCSFQGVRVKRHDAGQ